MLKQLVKNVIWGYKASSERYVAHLRKIGVRIGEDVTIYAPTKTFIDEQYPWMVSIGAHIRITEGVKILTHDYSWSVLKLADTAMKGVVLGASGEIHIGNNVVIGMNTIITRNVKIGDNVIIGAGSVVTKDCNENSVYAGNPAKYIMSIDEYIDKRNKLQLTEAKKLARMYYDRYKIYPEKEIFDEYFMLFSKGINLSDKFKDKIKLCGNPQDSEKYMNEQEEMFADYESFLKACFRD